MKKSVTDRSGAESVDFLLTRAGGQIDGRERGGFAAWAEATVFLQYFNNMLDERQPDKAMYPLDEILLLFLLAVLKHMANNLIRKAPGKDSSASSK